MLTKGYQEKKDIGRNEYGKVRYGIIGVGNIGSAHLESIMKGKVPNATVTALADIKEERLRIQKEKYPETDFKIYASGSDLIEKGSVDAVIVATPHYQHPELSIQALKKGIHVVCEKPAGVYTKQVKEMNRVAKEGNALFTIMFNQRTNSLPEDAGNDPRRIYRHHQKNKLADHRLVPLAKLL